jgi:hypothetical protein
MKTLIVLLLLCSCGGGRTCPRNAADSAEPGDQSAEKSCEKGRR